MANHDFTHDVATIEGIGYTVNVHDIETDNEAFVVAILNPAGSINVRPFEIHRVAYGGEEIIGYVEAFVDVAKFAVDYVAKDVAAEIGAK